MKDEGDPDFFMTENVYEIHGNIFYSRCFNECSEKIYSAPKEPEGGYKDPEEVPRIRAWKQL